MFAGVARVKYSILYFVGVVLVMGLFNRAPLLVDIGNGSSFSLWALAVGFWFVLRDFSQRELRHFVFIPMGLGIIVTSFMSQATAIATTISSSASELTDWAVYTFLRDWSFERRILISSLVSCPIDSFVFFAAFDFFHVIPGVSVFNWLSILAASVSKLAAALLVARLYRARGLQQAARV